MRNQKIVSNRLRQFWANEILYLDCIDCLDDEIAARSARLVPRRANDGVQKTEWTNKAMHSLSLFVRTHNFSLVLTEHHLRIAIENNEDK